MTDSFQVELRDVTKRFGDYAAVDDLSLQIRDGEFFSLIGPSGCGKTTTLRMIAGFEQPTEGEIFISGQHVEGIPAHHRPVRPVGFVWKLSCTVCGNTRTLLVSVSPGESRAVSWSSRCEG